jgi:spore maturation protein CgeB
LSRRVVATCRQLRPRWVLATGFVPLNAHALAALGKMGVRRLNYLTDDPWNPSLHAAWFFAALREYDHVFSVRRSNLADLTTHGCQHVSYVPFGFDADLFYPEPPPAAEQPRYAADVVFVGGADQDRVPYIAALSRASVDVALYGDYWSRYTETRAHHRGYADPSTLRKATCAAKVALCLVRRANRDGQVMRSYEAAAIGACMLVEDTPEHRELFGQDGEAVVYFRTIEQMLDRLRRLLTQPDERRRLAAAVRQRIVAGGHTYSDRLQTMLQEAT